jgi:hypothetical protein
MGARAAKEADTPARQWTFRIDNYHPTRLNQLLGVHWAVAGRMKRRDREMIAAHAALACVPRATGKRLVTLRIILGKGQRGADPDAFFKALLDAMVHAGLLVDDNRQGVVLAPVEYERAAKKATVITLVDIE